MSPTPPVPPSKPSGAAGAGEDGWICPSCLTPGGASTRYCSACGERRLPLPGWRSAAARWWRTLRALVLEPGRLTADDAAGRRQPWIAPLSLFLTINLVFFFGQALTGLNVLSIPLDTHLHRQAYSAQALRQLAQRLARRPLDRARFEDRFQLQQETLSKATVIAMVPLAALASRVLFRRRGSGVAWRTDFVHALHFYAFMLLFMMSLFALLAPALLGLKALGHPLTPAALDDVASTIEAGGIVAYQFVASARVYGGPAWRRLIAACTFVAVVLGALYLHRWAIFSVTTWVV
ncbi:MAG: DUF3667 domain-containing protein [Burkholderiales bacterium]|nr:DUF3667 domain-containing protein [Burkholderiales bacterium]